MNSPRLIIVVAVSLLCTTVVLAQASSGVVQRVIDGDTIVVSGVGTVRLIGINSPETSDPRKPVQYFATEATSFTKKIADGQRVELKFEGSRTDKYNRTRAYVYFADGTMLNAELIRQGYAYAYTDSSFSKMDEFRALQRDAMMHSRGLWAADLERTAQPPSPKAAAPVRVTAPMPVSNAPETVYATRTGAKYHREGCRFLARSQIPLALKDASARYGACSVCRPPILTTSPDVPLPTTIESAATRVTPAARAVSSSRCQATTKKGTQCSRNAQSGRNYCWQH